MKCTSDSGNLSFNNLGTGVDNTTSPREENLITKIFIFLILIFSNLELKSQNNLDSILNQKKRIEFDINDLDRNFWVKENENNFLVVKNAENGKNLNWVFKVYNKELKQINDTTILLDRSYTLKKISSNSEEFNFFLKKNYSNEKEYLVIKYHYSSNKITYFNIKLPLSLTIKKILFFDQDIIMHSNLKNGKNLVSIYNFNTGQLNNIYEYLYINNNILNIYKNNSKSFYVLISKIGNNNLNVIERKSYSLDGQDLSNYQVISSNKSIIESKQLFYENKDILISLSSKKNSNQAIGYKIDILKNNSQILNYEKNFLEIKELAQFFKNENKALNKKIEKERLENIRLGYQFYIDTVFITKNNIHISFESLKANFSNDGFSNFSYMPFYNTYTGRYDKKINPKFGGYSHDLSIYIISDFDGNIKWAKIEKINDLKTFYKKPYKNYILNSDHIIDFYINKGKVTLSKKEFKNINNLSTETYDFKVDEGTTVLKSETNPEGTIHWYGKNYLSYGIQKVKKQGANKIENKRVFFISNFEIN